MFSSTFDGERANAASLADRIVKDAGLTWEILLSAGARFAPKVSRRRDTCDPTPGEILAHHGAALTGWEKGFLATLIRRPREFWSPRQIEVLAEIRTRIRRAA